MLNFIVRRGAVPVYRTVWPSWWYSVFTSLASPAGSLAWCQKSAGHSFFDGGAYLHATTAWMNLEHNYACWLTAIRPSPTTIGSS